MAERGKRGSKRVVLPGGHAIESPRAQASRESGTESSASPREEQALHVCPECDSGLVHPTDWEPVGRSRWSVELRCPECEWRGKGIHDQRVMDCFDEVLDHGTEALLDDLQELTRAIMEEEVERFVDAIERDLILPEDF